MRSQRIGGRYLAGFVMVIAMAFFVTGTLGPARNSPYYWFIVPPPAFVALLLGGAAWSTNDRRSPRYSTAALLLLLVVLVFSHLLPRSAA